MEFIYCEGVKMYDTSKFGDLVCQILQFVC
jgi:hypothetical protein